MRKIKFLIEKNKEVISYLFWGVCTTCVCWGTYAFFAKIVNMSVVISNILSWISGTLFAYVTNKIWVFKSRSWKVNVLVKEIALFVSTRLVTGAIEIVAVPTLVSLGLNQMIWGVKGALAKVIVSVVVVLLNYCFSKLVIFKGK